MMMKKKKQRKDQMVFCRINSETKAKLEKRVKALQKKGYDVTISSILLTSIEEFLNYELQERAS